MPLLCTVCTPQLRPIGSLTQPHRAQRASNASPLAPLGLIDSLAEFGTTCPIARTVAKFDRDNREE